MARALNVFVNIGAKVGPSVKAAAASTLGTMSNMGRRMSVMGAEFSAAAVATEKRWGRFGQNASNFAHTVSLPMAAISTLGAKTAYEWAKVGNNIQAVTLMTDEQRKAIERVARSQIGSPTKNLTAALDLARTGLKATEIAAGLPIALKLAASDPESVDQARAADIITNVLIGMKMPVSELARAADTMAFAAAQSSSDVRLMGESFKYAGPLASRAGTTIEEASAAFMTMADAGIKGSESGVAFRSMLVRMIKLPKPAAAVMARYNMKIADYVKLTSKPTGKGIIQSLKASGVAAGTTASALDKILASDLAGEDLVEALTSAIAKGVAGGADAVDRDMLSTVISDSLIGGADKINWRKFIADAQAKGWSTGDIVNFFDTRQGARLATLFGDDLEKNLAEIQGKGAKGFGAKGFLDKMFALQNKGVVGSVNRLSQAIGGFVITLSETGIIDQAADFIDRFAGGITWLSKQNPGLLKFLTGLVLFAAVAGPVALLFGGLASGVKLLGGSLMFLARVTGARGLMGMIFGAAGRTGPKLSPFRRALGWIIKTVGFGLGRAVRFGIKAFRALAPGIMRAVGFLGTRILPALARLGPLILRGVGVAFALLSNPAGWVFLAVAAAVGAAALAWHFREQIAKAWTRVTEWFKTAFAGVATSVLAFDWGGLGMSIADKLTFGLASRIPRFAAAIKGAVAGVGARPTGAATAANGRFSTSGQVGSRSFGPPRARGGSVSAGTIYPINEKGEEGFAPGRSGTIIPAHVMAAMRQQRGGGGAGLTVGDIHIHGANDPESTRRVVRQELKRIASSQRAGLHD